MPIPSLREASWLRIWLCPIALGLLASLTIGLMSLPPARSGRVAGAVIMSGQEGAALAAMLQSDPDLRLVDRRWRGRVIFVVFRNPDFPAAARKNGIFLMFDAKSVGCSFAV